MEDSMGLMSWARGASFSLLALAGFLAAGCGKTTTTGPEGAQPVTPAATTDDRSGWWCSEHGVPEEICAQCNAKVAAEYQKKGDWCKEHNRPESQCFICNPKRAEKFAAEYEAKFGKKPPKPEGT
jgi:cobalt-zinc-cadmium efflux system membrane fusion protein